METVSFWTWNALKNQRKTEFVAEQSDDVSVTKRVKMSWSESESEGMTTIPS